MHTKKTRHITHEGPDHIPSNQFKYIVADSTVCRLLKINSTFNFRNKGFKEKTHICQVNTVLSSTDH